MMNDTKLDRACELFSSLCEQKQDQFLGILEALDFAYREGPDVPADPRITRPASRPGCVSPGSAAYHQ